jgi:hypothetical protein
VLVLAMLIGFIAPIIVTDGGPNPRVSAEPPVTAKLVTVGPIRLADTRLADCECEPVDESTIKVDITAHPDVPDDAVAAAVTITALPTELPGHVRVYPSGQARPTVSTLNTRPDRVVANSAIVPLGTDGAVELYLLRPGDVVVDLTGVFVPATDATDGRYQAVPGRRLIDTRTTEPPSGPRAALEVLRVGLPDEVDDDAIALVINITAVGQATTGHVRVRPAGSSRTDTSVLNYDGSRLPIAASVVVPVNESGFDIESWAGGHLIVDLLGWFTGPSAERNGEGLFVPTGPDRIADTRGPEERIHAGGTIEVAPPVSDAAALVTNVTAVRPDRRGYVAGFPARTERTGTSTVNPSYRDHTVANFAITPLSDVGTAYYSWGGTDLIVDVTGWFTGDPLPTTTAEAPNAPPWSRVLLVGDSTLASLFTVPQTTAALIGFDAVYDRGNCRRLLYRSCVSPTTGVRPTTAVEAIYATPGTVDIVVIKAGYNDWFTDFQAEFEAVVGAARDKGAHTVLWMSYNTAVYRPTELLALQAKNASLRAIVGLPEYHDVHLADWGAYSDPRRDWFWDGIQVTTAGAWAQPDFISRWIAHLERRPCPRPWAVGGVPDDPCPKPESLGAVPDPIGLYSP